MENAWLQGGASAAPEMRVYAIAAVTVSVAATPTTPSPDRVFRSGSQTVGIITSEASSMYAAELGA